VEGARFADRELKRAAATRKPFRHPPEHGFPQTFFIRWS
jgi:hypothetical protein